MRALLWFVLLCCSSVGLTKKPALYRCQQANGKVVIQDRRCQATHLTQAKPQPTEPQRLTVTSKSATAKKPNAKGVMKRQERISSSQKNNKRSPYFTVGWERFIPANWQLHQIKTQRFDQLLMSRSQFNGLSDFREGVKLSVYADTVRKHRQGAFAHALQIYERIRDNESYTLLDSQFKSHPNYKVFNIKYQLGNRDLALTEFYIDETHNDLFVLTVQARETSWLPQWQFAERIINHL